jgi:hypothetical protein
MEYDWLSHDEFIDLVQRMDLGMQVSFTETFNIVTADFVNNNIPVVVSKEVSWVNPLFWSSTNKVESMIGKIKLALTLSKLKFLNKIGLWWFSFKSEKIWTKYFGQTK